MDPNLDKDDEEDVVCPVCAWRRRHIVDPDLDEDDEGRRQALTT